MAANIGVQLDTNRAMGSMGMAVSYNVRDLRKNLTQMVNVPIANVLVAGIVPVQHGLWLFPSDVKSGVVYGPAGEFTGAYAGGGGGGPRVIGSPIVRRLH